MVNNLYADYVLFINNKDVIIKKISYENTSYVKYYKKVKETISLIDITLEGDDLKGRFGSINFEIDLTIDELNKYPKNEIIDISKHLVEFEPMYYEPGVKGAGFMSYRFPSNKEEDMFRRFTSLHLFKKDDNKFIFRFDNPDDNIFAAFEIVFDKENS